MAVLLAGQSVTARPAPGLGLTLAGSTRSVMARRLATEGLGLAQLRRGTEGLRGNHKLSMDGRMRRGGGRREVANS